jgi:hypothetical protein
MSRTGTEQERFEERAEEKVENGKDGKSPPKTANFLVGFR